MKRRLLSLIFCAMLTAVLGMNNVCAQALPGNSVYQLPIQLTDQDGQALRLADKRGQPVIISMFYNSCQFVCPMLIDTLQATVAGLSDEQRDRLSMVLVSFDPARDTVAVLKSIQAARQLTSPSWTLARTDTRAVRKLAATLGIQYRLLESGDYNHSTSLVLLDAQGRIVGNTNVLGEVDPKFLALIQKTLR